MVNSSHNWRLDLRTFGAAPLVSCPGSALPAVPADIAGAAGCAAWLASTPLSLCKLTRLRPSSSVALVSARLGGLAEPMLLADTPFVPVVPPLPFICWIMYVIFSVFIASSMFAVAVGSSASTV